MLSLSPRYDLFRFNFPKDFFPPEILEKYQRILNKNTGVLINPVDYINESIQGITFPGIQDLNISQDQVSHNTITRDKQHLNIEPFHENYYTTPNNPLSNINAEFNVTLRQNQGLLNYFMMYETFFYIICKPELYQTNYELFYIDILNEMNTPSARIKLFQPVIDSMDGLDFSYSKIDRQSDTFDVGFKFNNIDYVFLDEKGEEF